MAVPRIVRRRLIMAGVRIIRRHTTAAAATPRHDRTVRRHVPTRHHTAPPLAAEAVPTVEVVAATTAVEAVAEATQAAVVDTTNLILTR